MGRSRGWTGVDKHQGDIFPCVICPPPTLHTKLLMVGIETGDALSVLSCSEVLRVRGYSSAPCTVVVNTGKFRKPFER
ncbi:hypothetical protein CHUAL_003770 [Chamberlinius hualienensis]